jgi:hypothetical protein
VIATGLRLQRGNAVQNNLKSLMHAAMAELADALDSGSSVSNDVEVRVLLAAPTYQTPEVYYGMASFLFASD